MISRWMEMGRGLRETLAALEAVGGLLPVRVTVKDLTGVYLYVNDVGAQTYGLRAADMVGRHCGDVFPMHASQWLVNDQKVIESGQQQEFEEIAPGASGDLLHYMAAKTPLLINGKVMGVVSVARNITTLKRYEQQLADMVVANDQIISSTTLRFEAAKEHFLASASHDLSQPLQTAFTLLDAVRRGDSGSIERLEVALATMKVMLDGLADLTRLSVGGVSLTTSRFALLDALNEVTQSGLSLARGKPIGLSVSGDTSVVMETDRGLFTRMLASVVGNAIQHTTSGSVEVQVLIRGANVVLNVVDTGPGIPADKLDAIWEEFVQIGNDERSRDRGYGLGLSLVRRIAGVLDVPVAIKSTVGEGTVFTADITNIVCDARLDIGPPRIGPLPEDITNRRVLIIDDDSFVLSTFCDEFESRGANIEGHLCVSDAEDVVRAGFRPEILITDYRMAEANGIEAVARIRALAGNIPAIVLTGDGHIRDEVVAAGLGFMAKPVATSVIVAACVAALDDA